MRLHNIQGLYIHEYYLGVPPIKKNRGRAIHAIFWLFTNVLFPYRLIKQPLLYRETYISYRQKDVVAIPNTKQEFGEEFVYIYYKR